MIYNFIRFKKVLCFVLVIMAIIPLYRSVVFGDEGLDNLKILKESLTSPVQEFVYTTDRFDNELIQAQSERSNNNFEESNKIAISYFDKAFVDGCPSLGLISQNYESLGKVDLAQAYKDAGRFCELVRLPDLESEMSELHKSIQKHAVSYPDELAFGVFDFYFRSVLKGEKVSIKDEFKESLSYGFVETVTQTKGTEFTLHTLDEYNDLLKQDFVPKPALYAILGTKYIQTDLLVEALKYEDIVRNRGEFRSNNHNIYHHLALSESLNDNDRLYYYLSSLEFDSSRGEEYTESMVELFFNLGLFNKIQQQKAFSEILPGLDTNFFDDLIKLNPGSQDIFQEILKIVSIHSDNEKYKKIEESKLLEYLYTFISEKNASEICSSLSEANLLDRFSKSVNSFVICEAKKETQDKVETLIEKVETEDAVEGETNQSANSEKTTNLTKKNNSAITENLIFILSIIIFIIIVSFIAFIFLKKK